VSQSAVSAIVLDTLPYRDADLIVKLLASSGKITAIAYYARKSRARFPSGLDRLTMVDAIMSPGRGMHVINSAVTRDVFWGVKQDFDKGCAATLFAEMLLLSHFEPDEPESIFALAATTLAALDQCSGPETWPRTLHAIMRLLHLLGFLPPEARCMKCPSPRTDLAHGLDPRTGEIRCRDHRTEDPSIPLSLERLTLLDAALSSPSATEFFANAPTGSGPAALPLLQSLAPLLENLVSAPLKTLAFLGR